MGAFGLQDADKMHEHNNRTDLNKIEVLLCGMGIAAIICVVLFVIYCRHIYKDMKAKREAIMVAALEAGGGEEQGRNLTNLSSKSSENTAAKLKDSSLSM
jgi:hypothetical protein